MNLKIPTKITYRYPSKAHGIMDRELHPGYKFRGLRGGRGSGKSWTCAQQVVKSMREFHCFVVAVRETQKSMEESSKKLLSDTIARLGLTDEFEIQQTVITHKVTGSRCIFLGFHANPAAIKSLESAHILWAEEADQISLESWRIIIPTMRVKGWNIWASWNPALPSTPVEVIFNEEKHRAILRTVTYKDNPWLDDSKIEEAERMKVDSLEDYMHIYMGSYRPTGDNTVISLRTVMEAQNRIVVAKNVPIIASLDVAYFGDDDSVLTFRKGDEFLGQLVQHGMAPEQLERWACDQVLRKGAKSFVIDEAGSPGVFTHCRENLQGEDIQVLGFNGGWVAKNSAYSNLRTECWFLMEQWLRNSGQIPKDRELMDQLINQPYDYNTSNQKALMTKKVMKSKGIGSPDKGDSLSFTFFHKINTTGVPQLADLTSFRKR